ncbi:undecaprenyl diphosphate synthase family protein [Streptomyces anulatus]
MTEPSVLTATVRPGVPAHVALVLDGNRRWAAQRGLSVAEGHRQGIGKIPDVLQWCEEEGVAIVTQWILSVRNLQPAPRNSPVSTGRSPACANVSPRRSAGG